MDNDKVTLKEKRSEADDQTVMDIVDADVTIRDSFTLGFNFGLGFCFAVTFFGVLWLMAIGFFINNLL